MGAEYMGTVGLETFSVTIMKTLGLLLSLGCLLALVSAEPRYKKLQRTDLSCSLVELAKCQAEIEQAVADCGHITDIASFQTCVNDLLAATDCIKCICDAVPSLPFCT